MSPNHGPRCKGFTLIELMVAVVVMGILAAIAYPAYTAHVQRSRRADAVALLSAVMQAQERYRTNRVEYAHSMTDLGLDAASITSHYAIANSGAIAGIGNPAGWAAGYVATARAVSTSPQANDRKCAAMGVRLDGSSLTYFATDAAGADTSASCWPR